MMPAPDARGYPKFTTRPDGHHGGRCAARSPAGGGM